MAFTWLLNEIGFFSSCWSYQRRPTGRTPPLQKCLVASANAKKEIHMLSCFASSKYVSLLSKWKKKLHWIALQEVCLTSGKAHILWAWGCIPIFSAQLVLQAELRREPVSQNPPQRVLRRGWAGGTLGMAKMPALRKQLLSAGSPWFKSHVCHKFTLWQPQPPSATGG